MNLECIAFNSGDPGKYYYHQWSPQPGQQPKAWVHIIHGMAEHSARYQHLADYLNQQGYMVSADDHRGHGVTGDTNGNLYHLADSNGWNQLIDDQYQLIEHLAGQHNLPLVILGHSMGSFIATRFCQVVADKGADLEVCLKKRLKGLVLSGSNYSPSWACKIVAAIARIERHRQGISAVSNLLESLLLGAFNNGFKPCRTDKDWVSRDEAVVGSYIADPYCGGAISTQSWYDFFTGLGVMSAPREMAKIDPELPVYLFSGSLDPVGRQGEGVKKLAAVLESAGINDIACKLYPGGRHEMLNETNKLEVYGDLLSWLDSRVGETVLKTHF
ncbi:MAG: lysophospholipase [Porticoccaceae bacterium]